MNEIWKPIRNFETYYLVSNLGRIKSLKRKIWNGIKYFDKKEIILKPHFTKKKYLSIGLRRNNLSSGHMVHRLVAKAFIPNPLNKKTVNHINGIKDDNRVENLEWNTVKENVRHSWRTGLSKPQKGEINNQSKLKEEDVIKIKKLIGNVSQVDIAKKYNVHPSTIYLIKKGKNWKYLDKE